MIILPAHPILTQARRYDCLGAMFAIQDGVWISRLRSGAVTPSFTLRDFAAEPATWHVLQQWIADHVAQNDNLRIVVDFEWTVADVSTSYELVGYGVTTAPVSIRYTRWSSTVKRIDVYTTMLTKGSGWISVALGNNLAPGHHRLVVNITGDTLSAALDGGTPVTNTGATRQMYVNTDPVQSTFPGNLHEVTVDNLTTGKSWGYPTWAEEKRLLTYTNVRRDRGVFEAANTSLGWSIKTQVTGTVGSVMERRADGVYTDSGKFNAATGIFTGLATDQLYGLMIYDHTLTANEILAITNLWAA